MHQPHWEGRVASIHVAPQGAAEMVATEQVRAVAGRGLEGDRYFMRTGTKKEVGPDREVTLIQWEALDAFRREYGATLADGAARRNIVTRGVPLNELVGREFHVGEARLRGIRLCEPCGHLAGLTGQKVLPGLVHRAGLRAQIIEGGIIRVGDLISE